MWSMAGEEASDDRTVTLPDARGGSQIGPDRGRAARWRGALVVLVVVLGAAVWSAPAVSVYLMAGGGASAIGAPGSPGAPQAEPAAAGSPSPPGVVVVGAGDPGVAPGPSEASPSPGSGGAPAGAAPGSGGASAAAASGGYTFEATNSDGTPVRWDACQPIHYLVDLRQAPSGAADDLARAIAMVSQATGLTFVSDGTTAAVPTTSWITGGSLGANGWPDVLIGWTTPGATDLQMTDGMGGITQYEAAGWSGHPDAMVAAVVALNVDTDTGPGFGVTGRGALLLHELGHVVGLGHSGDPTQMMYPVRTRMPGAYGAADLAGLARLGDGGCTAIPTRAQAKSSTP